MRTRTAKKLAQRIDLEYFKRPAGLRRWRGLLSFAVPMLGLVWLGAYAVAGDRTIYSSGPVSSAHAFAETKCEVCHVPSGSSFRAHVTDTGCLSCHAGPSHVSPAAVSPRPEPSCATCHREHQGRVQLAAVADTLCVDCHGDLPVPIGGFPTGHPEFAVLRDGYRDPGGIRFNHEVHANPELRGPNGPEPLQCATCHQPELVRVSSQRRLSSGLMKPVAYEQQCARCHSLFFDPRLDAEAPHGETGVVRSFVRQSLAEFVRDNPRALVEPDPPDRRIPLNFPPAQDPPARTAAEWVAGRTARAERLLFERTCAYCHGRPVRSATAEAAPEYLPAGVRTAWMPGARFDHAPHLMVTCESCHTGASASRETSDVLMPPIATCATCHSPSKGGGAQCAQCHGYHDWTQAQPVTPHFRLSDFQ